MGVNFISCKTISLHWPPHFPGVVTVNVSIIRLLLKYSIRPPPAGRWPSEFEGTIDLNIISLANATSWMRQKMQWQMESTDFLRPLEPALPYFCLKRVKYGWMWQHPFRCPFNFGVDWLLFGVMCKNCVQTFGVKEGGEALGMHLSCTRSFLQARARHPMDTPWTPHRKTPRSICRRAALRNAITALMT